MRRRVLGLHGGDDDGADRCRAFGFGEYADGAGDGLAELAVPARPRVAGPGLSAVPAHGVLGAALVEGGGVALPPPGLHPPEARDQHFAGRLIRRGIVECVRTSQRGLPFRAFDGLDSLAALDIRASRSGVTWSMPSSGVESVQSW